MARHANIPIFIPHLGCPNACVFCNQRTISGVERFSLEKVTEEIDASLETLSPDDEVELAFFGGSFTGIERTLMISLLEIGKSYIEAGKICAIRCSTRPDYINEEILAILRRYGVKTIELGLQSCSEGVLELCKRGHDRADEERACRLIVEGGFALVGQMMIGLPGSTAEDELETARFIVEMGASGARIYPTVVFKDTELCHMTECGEYVPLTLGDAVERSSNVMEIFEDAGVHVIRIGLCASENLADKDKFFAGPNHPALGELVMSNVLYRKIKKEIVLCESKGKNITVFVARGFVSRAVGHGQVNKLRLIKEFDLRSLKVREKALLSGYEVEIYEEGIPECT